MAVIRYLMMTHILSLPDNLQPELSKHHLTTALRLGSAKLRVLAMRIELMYSMMALKKRTGMQPPLDDTQDLSSLQKQTGEDNKEKTS